jgi:hypothetical protein
MKNTGRHLSMDAKLVEGEDSNLTTFYVLRISKPDRELIHESLRTEIEPLETLYTKRPM